MDVTINYILQSGKENEFNQVLNNSVLKDFEKMDNKGDFIVMHYVVLNDGDKDKDEKKIK